MRRHATLLCAAAALAGTASMPAVANEITKATVKPVVLFAVGVGATTGYAVEPIAIISRGALRDIPVSREGPGYPSSAKARDDWIASVNRFARRAFPRGTSLTALDAGASKATLRIVKGDSSEWEPGCGGWGVPVALAAGMSPAKGYTLAVTASARVSPLPLARRTAKQDELNALRHAAEGDFARRGLAAEFIPLIEPSGITSFAMRQTDEPAILVGHFSIFVPEGQKGHGVYNLFLILERSRSGWTATYADYDPPTRSTEGYYREEPIDLIDVDRDGRPELVTHLWAHEAFDFALYRKQGGQWHRVFLGGGGSC